MDSKNPAPESTSSLSEGLVDALGSQAVEAQCMQCKAVEWVIPLDLPLDQAFLANYVCDECETPAPGNEDQ